MSTPTLEAIEAEVRRLAETMPEHTAVPTLDEIIDPDTRQAVADGKLRIDDLGSITCTYLGFERSVRLVEAWDDGDMVEVDALVSAPRCIIGTAAHNLGMSDEELEAVEGEGAMDVIEALTGMAYHHSDVTWFTSVQGKQDSGMTWAQAVAGADREADADEGAHA